MHQSIHRFLDVEAREDDNEDGILDSKEDEELIEQWLDDGVKSDEPDGPPSNSLKAIAPLDNRKFKIDRLIEKILTATRTENLMPRHNNMDDDDDDDLVVERIKCMPRDDNYPLWRVKCRMGAEEIAVFNLLGTACPSHQLRSAFTRGSIRGSIYLECTMNTALVDLLRIMPGVICSHRGVKRNMVDRADQVDLLKMKTQKVKVQEGGWVLVKKGLYNGDVGVVSAVYSWGACVLLVPCLDPSLLSSSSPQCCKHKASSTKLAPCLFDPEDFSSSSTVQMASSGERSFSIGLSQFEDGLLAKDFDFHLFSTTVLGILYNHHLLFCKSSHPLVVLSHMLRPLEWFIKEGDQILVSSGASGVIRSFGVFSAEVELSDPTQSVLEWIEQVPWYKIQKNVKVRQYVHAHAGPHAGMAGWVISVNGDWATLAIKILDGPVLDHKNALNFVDVLVNCSEVMEPPFTAHTQQAVNPDGNVSEVPNSLTQQASQHPWCGMNVKILRKFHPKKGQTAVIKEVTGQLDGSDIKLVVQLTVYNPSAPFQTITVNYCDVVELESLKELILVIDPGPKFCRPPKPPQNEEPNDQKNCPRAPPSVCDAGGQTPFLTNPDMSGSVAWDPSSRTPMPLDYLVPPESQALPSVASSSSSLSHIVESPPRPPVESHVLLDPRLVGALLNVIVDGGGYSQKELAVSVSVDSTGAPTLRYVKYCTSTLLKPEWVTPKRLNPTHDNGLLIVIQGEHCGKYTRHLHHRRENGIIRTVIVAVVSRHDGQPDRLTGEQLELDVKFLCTVTETKKQKDMNWNVMQEACKCYRNTHR